MVKTVFRGVDSGRECPRECITHEGVLGSSRLVPEVVALGCENPRDGRVTPTTNKSGCSRVVWEGYSSARRKALQAPLFGIWLTSRLLWVEGQIRSGSPVVGGKKEGR